MTPKLFLAGETRFEHATYGFGDRYSTVEPLPYSLHYTIGGVFCQSYIGLFTP